MPFENTVQKDRVLNSSNFPKVKITFLFWLYGADRREDQGRRQPYRQGDLDMTEGKDLSFELL